MAKCLESVLEKSPEVVDLDEKEAGEWYGPNVGATARNRDERAASSLMLEEKLSWWKKQGNLEGKRSKLCLELFNRQNKVEAQHNDLIASWGFSSSSRWMGRRCLLLSDN